MDNKKVKKKDLENKKLEFQLKHYIDILDKKEKRELKEYIIRNFDLL